VISHIDISSDTAVNNIAVAAHDVGAFYISNHGIDTTLLEHFQYLTGLYFSLPLEEKLQLHISHSLAHRGYFPIGEESAKGNYIADLKEGFDMALDLPLTDPSVMAGIPFHGPNVYPQNPIGFEAVMVRYYNEMRLLAERLCVLFARALNLEPHYFLEHVTKPLAQLRILHYPPQAPLLDHLVSPKPVGCGAHTDYGIITVLWQDSVGGLEIMLPNGRWMAAPPREGTFFCNLGDMIQRWTNGFWKAAPHRVMNFTTKERYSAAFFFDPNYDCVVAPLENFVSDSMPPLYQPVTMGDYLRDGFDGTFAYRGHNISLV
jgi:isopenicillin N synthase-like dioxygenase